jgi:hypothetical protein
VIVLSLAIPFLAAAGDGAPSWSVPGAAFAVAALTALNTFFGWQYRVQPGQTYIYALDNPSLNPTGRLFTGSGGGHEIGGGHRNYSEKSARDLCYALNGA